MPKLTESEELEYTELSSSVAESMNQQGLDSFAEDALNAGLGLSGLDAMKAASSVAESMNQQGLDSFAEDALNAGLGLSGLDAMKAASSVAESMNQQGLDSFAKDALNAGLGLSSLDAMKAASSVAESMNQQGLDSFAEDALNAGLGLSGLDAMKAASSVAESMNQQGLDFFAEDALNAGLGLSGLDAMKTAAIEMASLHIKDAFSDSFKTWRNISELSRKVISKSGALISDSKLSSEKVIEYKNTVNDLSKKLEEGERINEIQYILNCVNEKAKIKIKSDASFRDCFCASGLTDCVFVVSIDIRRSTDLMLKARTPELFAEFISELCYELMDIIKSNYGVVDKFTGDGVLAFYPRFFSGSDSGYFALKSVKEANQAFERIYFKHRKSFNSVIKDVGLGSGVDYGSVRLLQMAGSLTVVGHPVVYACRLGGAPAGKVYLNQPAYEIVADKYGQITIITEAILKIKHDGDLICYDVVLEGKNYLPVEPDWVNDMSVNENKEYSELC